MSVTAQRQHRFRLQQLDQARHQAAQGLLVGIVNACVGAFGHTARGGFELPAVGMKALDQRGDRGGSGGRDASSGRPRPGGAVAC